MTPSTASTMTAFCAVPIAVGVLAGGRGRRGSRLDRLRALGGGCGLLRRGRAHGPRLDDDVVIGIAYLYMGEPLRFGHRRPFS